MEEPIPASRLLPMRNSVHAAGDHGPAAGQTIVEGQPVAFSVSGVTTSSVSYQ